MIGPFHAGKAFDTYQADVVAAKAPEIVAGGFMAVGLYYDQYSRFKVPITAVRAKAISAAGLFIWSIWENGEPTSAHYFGAARGQADAILAMLKAKLAGQPAGTPIYFTVDYDPSEGDLPAIKAYFAAIRAAFAARGNPYKVGVYGSGLVCRFLSELGLVEYTHLSQSRGFQGYADWLPHASIVQGPVTRLFGMDCDLDTTNGHAGGWQIA